MKFLATPLHSKYGVEVQNIQLRNISASSGYNELRCLFEKESLLYFSDQDLDDSAHLALGALFGPREDRSLNPMDRDPAVSRVSNVKQDNTLYGKGEKRLLDLQSNMLWHTDSTFLPVPALANILIGRVIPSSGSSTEFASTRVALKEMPDRLKQRIHNVYFKHNYSHSRRKIDPNLAADEKFTHWGNQIWKAVWKNPVNQQESLYIASHACEVIGMDTRQGLDLIDELLEWCTQSRFVYSHSWQVGDVLIWDERAMLHRGVPWDYTQSRTLSSICVSAQSIDGLDDMRYPPRH